MNKTCLHALWIVPLIGLLIACGNSNAKELPAAEKNEKKDSVLVEKADIPVPPSKYANLLMKFKPISFDTLKVYYDSEDKKFRGIELSLKEGQLFEPDLVDKSWGKLSGVYACYQFPIDSTTIGLIVRTPSEYSSSAINLFLFDTKKDVLLKNYDELANEVGDGGEYYQHFSWLFKTKKNEIHSFNYFYESYNHEIMYDSSDTTLEEIRSYSLNDCMSSKFTTISKNDEQLKKRFKSLLKKDVD